MKKSSIILIAIIAVAIAMILVIYTDSSTYSTFTEAKEKKTELYVVGQLNKDKALHYDPKTDANKFSSFMRENEGTEGELIFRGAKPQDIERSEQIVLTGKMDGNVFRASKILMKCPSKYNDKSVVTEINATAFNN
ncbi:MAG TPA: cytochrome C biogenesis protein [Sphingobacterium sp.]|nr:cytochrome C biogenesis protein [Sphingobacterium sp.]